jgi:hypothetical protein
MWRLRCGLGAAEFARKTNRVDGMARPSPERIDAKVCRRRAVGLPVSAGTIEGRARVILELAEAYLEAGDILVACLGRAAATHSGKVRTMRRRCSEY